MPGSQTTRGRSGTRDDVSGRVAFRESYHVGTPGNFTFAAQWLACIYGLPLRCKRRLRLWIQDRTATNISGL